MSRGGSLGARLVSVATRWAEGDPDGETRQRLEQAIAAGEEAFLRACFEQPLSFGTAGLRGPVGPGPAHVCLALVAQLGWAVGDFLARESLAARGVVVGYDARPDSRRFARRLADVLAVVCDETWLFAEAVPTPWVASACRQLGAAAGLVVTASHNPAGDNGIKLYDQEGIQIVAPWDEEIEQRLRRAPAARAIPLEPSKVKEVPDSVIEGYFKALGGQIPSAKPAPRAGMLRVAYSPLCGVGLASVRRALRSLPVELLVVGAEAEPDGTFPNIPFPNPEEPGVLDPLVHLAEAEGAEVAIANDPDADRVAIALPTEHGEFVQLTGDELGLLLADEALRTTAVTRPLVVSSIVSSPGLDELLHEAGGAVIRTLTGFKWVARVLAREPNAVFAYEEALGYCFRSSCGRASPLDKDGIAAALHVSSLLLEEGSGRALLQRLAGISRRIGHIWASSGQSLRFEGSDAREEAARVVAALRSAPPVAVLGSRLVRMTDFSTGAEARPDYLGLQDLLCFDFDGGSRVLVRPSGTEPKLKFYVHVRGNVAEPFDFVLERRRLRRQAEALGEEFTRLVRGQE